MTKPYPDNSKAGQQRRRQAEQVKALSTLCEDPLRFISLCWPGMALSLQQQEILLSVRDNLTTFVHAANKCGKTRIAAVAALWFFLTRTPARVITSSSSAPQLETVLWSELQHLIGASQLRLPILARQLNIKKLRRAGSSDVEPLDYLLGQVTNQAESFQGHHLERDKPRVLAIFDEASGVPDEYYDAAESWAHRMLVIGNPLSTANFFYRHCKAGDQPDPAGGPGLLRKVIHVDGRDSPNVQTGMGWKEAGRAGPPPAVIPGLLTFDEFIRRQQSWDEVQKTMRLYGHFYEGEHARMFPSSWLDQAMDRQRWQEAEEQHRQVQAIGLDVAAGGRDKTCWTLADQQGVIQQIILDIDNTMETVGRTINLVEEHRLSPNYVAIDAGGGGKQIADRLWEQGYGVKLVGFGEAAESKQAYKNRRAELYGTLRSRLDPQHQQQVFLLPPQAHELRQELAILPLTYDSEGRLEMISKRANRPAEVSINKLLGRSPDRADSLVLAVWMLEWRKRYPDYSSYEFVCSGADDRPPTAEELENMDPFFRDLIECDLRDRRRYDVEVRWQRNSIHSGDCLLFGN